MNFRMVFLLSAKERKKERKSVGILIGIAFKL
jgi:hypothetical protein